MQGKRRAESKNDFSLGVSRRLKLRIKSKYAESDALTCIGNLEIDYRFIRTLCLIVNENSSEVGHKGRKTQLERILLVE